MLSKLHGAEHGGVLVNREFTEVTVVGDDRTGLIASVTSLLFERGINIEDLDQAVREGVFRMSMRVDTAEMVCTRETLRADLSDLADELDVDVQVRFPSERETSRIAVLVTKESHCLEAVFEAWADGRLDADVSVVIGNHPDLAPLADRYDVPFHDIGDEKGTPDETELLEHLETYDVDLVVLARYMRILSPDVVFRYQNRIINVHPSLLPAFPGAEAYLQALEAGVRIAGVTAHYVTTDLDQRPIIAQRAFNVPRRGRGGGPGAVGSATRGGGPARGHRPASRRRPGGPPRPDTVARPRGDRTTARCARGTGRDEPGPSTRRTR